MSGCFGWALPLFSCCFAALAMKRKSGWGICGSSCCVVVVFFQCDLICLLLVQANCAYVPLFSPLMSLSGPCHSAFTANPEEKKKSETSTKDRVHKVVRGVWQRDIAALWALATLSPKCRASGEVCFFLLLVVLFFALFGFCFSFSLWNDITRLGTTNP